MSHFTKMNFEQNLSYLLNPLGESKVFFHKKIRQVSGLWKSKCNLRDTNITH